MEIKKLKYFICAAKHLNFTKAAQECCVVQTSMSQQIALLEKEIGVKLFDRNNRTMSLTKAGEAFLKEAKNIVVKYQQASEIARASQEDAHSILQLGFAGKLLRKELPEILKIFKKQYPKVIVHLRQGTVEELVDLLEIGTIHCMLSLQYDFYNLLDWMQSQALFSDQLMVALPKDHPLAHLQNAEINDLNHQPFVLYTEKGVGEKQLACATGGYPLNVVAELYDSESAEILLEAGYGMMLCLKHMCNWDNPFITYIEISGKNSSNNIVFQWNKHNLHPHTKDLLNIMTNYVKHLNQ